MGSGKMQFIWHTPQESRINWTYSVIIFSPSVARHRSQHQAWKGSFLYTAMVCVCISTDQPWVHFQRYTEIPFIWTGRGFSKDTLLTLHYIQLSLCHSRNFPISLTLLHFKCSLYIWLGLCILQNPFPSPQSSL